MKRKSKDIIIYNTQPDPLKSIKEYEYDSSTGKPKLVKQTLYKYDNNYHNINCKYKNEYTIQQQPQQPQQQSQV